MTHRLLAAGSLAMLLLSSAATHAEEGFKYRKLKPADPPCLFLLDENTGEPTGNAVNPPCVLGGTIVNPGDNVDPGLRARHGKAADAASGLSTGKREPAPRDAASGLPTGKRQHKPVSVTAPAGTDKPTPPLPARKPGPAEPVKPPGVD